VLLNTTICQHSGQLLSVLALGVGHHGGHCRPFRSQCVDGRCELVVSCDLHRNTKGFVTGNWWYPSNEVTMSILIDIGVVGAAASMTNLSLCRVIWARTSLGYNAWQRQQQNMRNRTRRQVLLHNGTSHINQSWWLPSSYGCHGAPLAVPKHTTISKHTMQQVYVVKTREKYYCWHLYDHLGHEVLTNHCAQRSPVAMAVPPAQSVSGNDNSTYMPCMSPLTAHALGLPCRQCSGAQVENEA
jgi:hypothetical protein